MRGTPSLNGMQTEIVTAADVSPGELDAFLEPLYPKAMRDFLRHHGSWWHGGAENRWLLRVDGVIAGYCAVIPARVALDGKKFPALWWVDLVIAPAYRSRGLQRLFDEKIRAVADLKLGFPNALAAAIHRKHGWVVREDFRVLLCPLQPGRLRSVRALGGPAGLLVKAAALGLSPLAWLGRRAAIDYRPHTARQVADPDPEMLSRIYARHAPPGTWTTHRSADYFRWRFLEAPYRHELRFFLAGPQEQPCQYLVARHLEVEGTRVVRILDAFGDFEDRGTRRDVVGLCLKTAVDWGAVQVTLMDTLPDHNRLYAGMGFVIRATARFCGHAVDAGTMARLKNPVYWTLADSDNDSPG